MSDSYREYCLLQCTVCYELVAGYVIVLNFFIRRIGFQCLLTDRWSINDSEEAGGFFLHQDAMLAP